MNNHEDLSWYSLTQSEKQNLKKRSFTVHPDTWDLTFLAQTNGRNVPDWNRQNKSMRFNHLDKLMLTKLMDSEVRVKNEDGAKKIQFNYSPHEVANYSFYKLRK